MTLPPLAIRLFGPLQVAVRGDPLPRVRTRSVEWLLALLTLRQGRAVNRSWLAGTLWPESSQSRALQNLRDDLLRLRQALGSESGRLLSPARDSLTLDLAGAAVDVLQFDAAIQAGDDESLRNAVAVYTGPLLEDCLEEWAFSERAARAEQLLTALETLAERAAERGEHGEAIRYLRRAEALDPLRDSLPRRLMASLAAAGDPAAAIQTYRDFRLRLQEELAAAPDAATTRLFHEIRAAARRPAGYPLAGGRRVMPAPAPEPASGYTGLPRPVLEPLPRPLTSLIGRDQDVAQIQEALEQGRLVTLVGGGGVGKTRLALEVALQAGDESLDAAAWVELAPLADGALVLPTVAAALGLRDEGGPGDADALTRRLVARLADGGPLLVLDNCEHLLDAAAAVVRLLLQRCPELRVLATSRQRLGLTGEVVWRVPSLPAPDPERLPVAADAAVAAVLGFAAVRLFVERAAAVQPGFRLGSGAEAAAVGQICRRLDGIPLALELAAARVTVLPVAQIAARLDDRFRLLTGGARGALPRQQTLRALIDWSHDLLTGPERVLLRRLSVFAGGWTLEAAEAVAALKGTGDREQGTEPSSNSSALSPVPCPLSPDDVLDVLDSLVDRSVVLVGEVPEGLRYRMLETVREYAREKLAASGEGMRVRDQHRDWYLQLAEQVEMEILGSGQEAALLTRLEGELDNFRAVLAWCQEEADAHADSDAAAAGLRLANALWWLWTSRGHLAEGQQWLEAALARSQEAPAAMRAKALLRTAHLVNSRGDRDRSLTFLKASRLEHEKALALARREGDRRQIAWALRRLAEPTIHDGDLDVAWSWCVEARQLFEELGDPIGLAGTLEWLARIAARRGDRQAARPLLEERLALCRELGGSGELVHALGGLGHLERDEGDYARARALYRESLRLRQKLGHQIAVAQSLEDFAVLAGREQQAERAIRLLGAEDAFCESLGARPPITVASEYERTVAEGRAALGEAVFAAAWAEGRGMTLDQAVEYALGEG